MSYLSIELGKLQQDVLALQSKYLQDLSSLIIEYYNKILNKKPILLNANIEDKLQNWQYSNEDDEILKLYKKLKKDLYNLLLKLLEEVYSLTSSRIKQLYKNNQDFPPSKIEFYNKDGKTIFDRLDRWFNPYIINENNQIILNTDFKVNKLKAISKIDDISRAEALNESEIVKFDKLLAPAPDEEIIKQFTIANEDDEDDCWNNPLCEVYWYQIYTVGPDGIPPTPLPLFHPNCECFIVPYQNMTEEEAKELQDEFEEQKYKNELKKKLKELLIDQEKYQIKLNQLQDLLNSKQDELNKLKEQLKVDSTKKIQDGISKTEKEIEEIENKIVSTEIKLDKIKNEIEHIEKELSKYKI